ncbi:odorant receptor Or2-like [Schistocerca gregaria]|uniref:odorant receptor Or2-like n=1 Tax=Schistocerca gregaria TaxID=7010 RepID=UPI00211EB745|nr:odorant receptor Or2-like [Schistocerca gregaria]
MSDNHYPPLPHRTVLQIFEILSGLVKSGLQRGQSVVRDESATFTWSETAHSVLKVNMRILFFCGAWPLSESALACAYIGAVLLASLANMAEAALGIAFGEASMDEITLVLPNTLTTACGVAKLAFFLSDRRRYFALVRRTDRLVAPQEELRAAGAAEAAEAVGRRVRAFALFLVALVGVQAVVWFPMPLIASPGERKLPFGQLPWSNYTQVPLYELSYTLQCVSSFTIANITLGFDCLFMGIMEFVAVQLDLLSLRLTNLRLDEAVCNSEKSRGRGCVAQTANAHDAAHRELCLCIERHQEIIRFTRYLEEMMSPIAMTQFMFSVLSVCVLLFQATYSDDFSAVFRCVAFLPLPGGQMYIYCWAAHRITEKAEALSVAAYSCQWVEASRRFKRSLAIVIFRAQQQLVITAGHLYPVNRTTFVSLVNASYSYYALLGHINKR